MKVEEWQRRELDKLYVCIFIMEEEVYMNHEGRIIRQKVYILFGVNLKGYKEFINVYVPTENTTSYWVREFMELRAKGIEDVISVSTLNNPHIEKGFRYNYKNTIIAPSLLEIYNKTKNYISRREHRILMQELLRLYRSDTSDEALKKYQSLIEELQYNKILIMILEKYRERIFNMFKYGKRIREVTSNTDTYNKMRCRINWNIKKSGVFEDASEIKKYVNEYLMEEEKKWNPSKKQWDKMINEMDTNILERISEMI